MRLNMQSWTTLHSRILQVAREEISMDLPVQQWQVLCEIAANPGVGSSEIKDRLNMSGGSLSRNTKMLSKFEGRNRYKGTIERKGYELITVEIDPYERRSRVYFLTTKGQKAMNEVWKAVEKFNVTIDPQENKKDVAI